jgi:hypothetical protein
MDPAIYHRHVLHWSSVFVPCLEEIHGTALEGNRGLDHSSPGPHVRPVFQIEHAHFRSVRRREFMAWQRR